MPQTQSVEMNAFRVTATVSFEADMIDDDDDDMLEEDGDGDVSEVTFTVNSKGTLLDVLNYVVANKSKFALPDDSEIVAIAKSEEPSYMIYGWEAQSV